MTTWIGIDNGVSGSCGILSPSGTVYERTPVKLEFNYTKKAAQINRIDINALMRLLTPHSSDAFCMIERPMVNPTRFKATTSALRALEATLIALETLRIPYAYIDSKEWQKALLPSGIKGSADLKRAAVDVAKRLFPNIDCGKDADGLLIAEFCKRTKS